MAFVRDRDAHTRGINAVAALDGVSPANRLVQRHKARQMAVRDRQLARVAMGAVNLSNTNKITTARGGTGIHFDYGTTNVPKPPAPGGGGGPARPGSQWSSPALTKVTMPRPTTADPTGGGGVVVYTPVGTPTVDTPPPPLPLPAPTTSSGGSSGGVGSGASGGAAGHGVVVDQTPDLPEVVEPTTGGGFALTPTTMLVGAGALIAAYLLMRKKGH